MAPPRRTHAEQAPDEGAEKPEEGDEAAEASSVADQPTDGAGDSQEGADEAQAAPSGEVRRYRMLVGVGSSKRGAEFEADANDRRVKSGWAVEVEAAGPPPEVRDALDS